MDNYLSTENYCRTITLFFNWKLKFNLKLCELSLLLKLFIGWIYIINNKAEIAVITITNPR